MKKILTIGLVFALLCCLCGCMDNVITSPDDGDVTQDVESGNITMGVVEGNTYSNESFGITCSLNSDWKFSSQEEILALNGMTGELMGDELAEALKDAPILYDMQATNMVNYSTISVNMEKVSTLQAATLNLKNTVESQFDAIKTGLTNAGYSNVQIEYAKITVDGKEYDGANVHCSVQGIDCYEVLFCFQRDNYIVNATVVSLQTDATADLLATFHID